VISGAFSEQFKLTVPEARFSGTTPTVGGPGEITIEGPFEAFYNGTNPPYTLTYMSTDTTV
jgi:hypothetical protein